jgi:hypothetical protein
MRLVVPYGDNKAIRESDKNLATNKRLKINMGNNARKALRGIQLAGNGGSIGEPVQ